MSSSFPRVALVTSGLGHRQGGIGVVSELLQRALEPIATVELWVHEANRGALDRGTRLYARSLLGAMRQPDLVLYTHVDLARLHVLNPLLQRVPSAVVLHGAEMWTPTSPLRRSALEVMNVRIAVSHRTLQLMRESNPWLPPTEVVWLGVPEIPDAPALPRIRRALIVGRMDPSERRKGHDPILDAWRRVRAALPDVELAVVGEGADRPRLERRVREEGLGGVRFTGVIEAAERDLLYRTSRLFLFPSLQEGFGLAAVEAAQVGTPVLAVKDSAVEEILPDSFLVSAPTGDELAMVIIGALSDEALAQRRGDRSKTRVRELFLESHFAARARHVLAPWLGDQP